MSGLAFLVLLLWVAAVVLWLVQAFSLTLGRVSPGWLGLALAGLAYLLSGPVS
jgi:hypothetical protein